MLDLIRLGERRWLARAVTRFEGEPVVLEEILECDWVPRVEAVVDVSTVPAQFVIRDRDEPAIVLAVRQLEMTSVASARSAPA